MRKLKLARSTRSIYLSLACLSLTVHLLLAFFCLSILQTVCILPPSSPSSSSRDTVPVQHGSRPSPLDAEQHPTNMPGQRPAEEDSFSRNEKKLSEGGKAAQEVKGRPKLEALFRHPLYNQPRPQLQEDDWLLRVKTGRQAQDEGQDEEVAVGSESERCVSDPAGNRRHGAQGDPTLRFHPQDRSGTSWPGKPSNLTRLFFCFPRRWSTSAEEGYDRMDWTSDVDTHPPWLRFHLGITRWELYNRRDPNLDQLTHYLATQRILGAGQRALTPTHIPDLLCL